MSREAVWAKLSLDGRAAPGRSLGDFAEAEGGADTIISGEHPSLLDSRASTAPGPGTSLSLSPPGSISAPGDAQLTGDLVVIGELGQGGMGRVLLARQTALERDVALKVPHRTSSPLAVGALVREARITGGLEHPGIVPVHALAFGPEGHPALVMKRIEGVSWATLIQDPSHGAWRFVGGVGRGRVELQVQLLLQLCNAVAFAHRQGVLHRDIKPANVLLGEFGEVYLADWGVATRKPLDGEQRPLGLVGTPLYFAPEMATGDDAQMDERTDVYLLGATLYHALSGQPPHPGTDLRQVLEHAWSAEPAPLPAEVPDELARVVARALARDKAQRYPSAVELKDALTQFLQHRSSHRLASAASARLAVLEAVVAQPAPSREQVAPLLSECRFGFMQALAEWPDNAEAREGLERAVRRAAWFEVKAGNALAARAFLTELREPPADLVAAVDGLEREEAQRRARGEHFARLERELDPGVAMRQRIRLFFTINVVVLMVSLLSSRLLAWVGLGEGAERFVPLLRLAPTGLAFLVAVGVGRRSLLVTRLNRRIVAMLGMSLVVVGLNRATAAALGLGLAATLTLDLMVLSTVYLCAGLLFHWGFYLGGVVALAGVCCGLAFPGHISGIFGGTVAAAIAAVIPTWRTWRSELVAPSARDARSS